jgi:hypothetical protein
MRMHQRQQPVHKPTFFLFASGLVTLRFPRLSLHVSWGKRRIARLLLNFGGFCVII